uniref:EGF-like domain-containing protein n=1 Tax=Steinernema glaseri TaxID=37863 RepID=A0A1I7Y9Q0_9BILA
VDGINTFTCECSADWTGETCTMRVMIYEVLKHFKSYDESTVKMLDELLDKPELIKETLPFFLALMSRDNQTDISWDQEDMFEWASFEGRELDVKKDIVKWNAATLGNCFTFNHDSRPDKFPLRYAGEREGFRALMRVRQDEY